LANQIDGVNLAGHEVGDVLEVTPHDAQLLIAEEWAIPTTELCRLVASRMTSSDILHLLRENTDQPRRVQEQRRAEDRFREELRDSRATIIPKIRR
jgi:hypothetical protein